MATAETDTERLLNRAAATERFRAGRTRTAGIFDVLTPDAYHDRPIGLRNPIVFFEGHPPGFSVNTLLKRGFMTRESTRGSRFFSSAGSTRRTSRPCRTARGVAAA